jgi:geranylgeranyl reductase family protein
VTPRDVIVVGAGPAGCASALFLKQQGLDVLVVDAATFPRDKVCGEGVSPESWRLFDALGVAQTVRALEPQPLRGMQLTSPDGTTFRGDYAGEPGTGLAVRRTRLDAVLVDAVRAAGLELHEDTRVTAFRYDQGLPTVELQRGQVCCRLSARLVVAAEGRSSVVARTLGLLRPHPRLRKWAVRGHWSGMEGLGDHGEMHVGGGGYCGIAPLGQGRANVAFVLERDEMKAAGGDLRGFHERTLQRWPRIAERLRHATLDDEPRAIGPLALECRKAAAPGVALVGDAAGFYDPFTGEGVTLALRGAELLAQAAEAALRKPGPANVTAYDAARRAATRDKFRLNRLLQVVVAHPWLADAVAHRLARAPRLADQLVGIAGDFVPARTALGPRFVMDLLRA